MYIEMCKRTKVFAKKNNHISVLLIVINYYNENDSWIVFIYSLIDYNFKRYILYEQIFLEYMVLFYCV